LKLNPHISIDCVIFGFDGEKLKTLLIKRRYKTQDKEGIISFRTDLKLPGDFISDEEDLNNSAYRILTELTGLTNIYLKQFGVFGEPDRINKKRDIEWLRETTGLPIKRVITITYYSLIKIDQSISELADLNDALWIETDEIKNLAFDHEKIVKHGLKTLRRKLQFEPVGVELLPEKFTLRQLQLVYEAILNRKLDKRNFRKKVFKANYLVQLNEKERGVAHKPAFLFRFDKKAYKDSFLEFDGFQF
jgi:hypothetical protein